MKKSMCLSVATLGLSVVAASVQGQFGGFASADIYASPFPTIAITGGDVDGDGVVDLLIGRSNEARVFINNGDGTFAASYGVPFGVSSANAELILADMTGDGELDIVAADSSILATVAVSPGNGDGTFAAPILTNANADFGNRAKVVAAHFNADNALDLAIVNVQTASMTYLMLGNGDGTLSAAQAIGSTPSGTGLAAEDLDDDGDQDIVVSGDNVFVFLGNGDGTFVAGATLASGSGQGIAIGDFNGDFIPDVAVASVGPSGLIDVFLGDGDGTFGPIQSFNGGGSPFAIAAVNLDGDATTDLAITNRTCGGKITALLGAGDGTFVSAGSFSTGFCFPAGLVALDLDGNTTPDVACFNDFDQNAMSVGKNQTDVDPPSAFALTAPASGVNGLAIPEMFADWPGNLNARLEWERPTGFTVLYDLVIATDPALTNVVHSAPGLTENRYTIPQGVLTHTSRYYWGVTASTQAGATGSTPTVFDFGTICLLDPDGSGAADFGDITTILGNWLVTCP